MVELKNISHIFFKDTINQNVAIDNISLSINNGDFITVIGSNGAGKSTLFNILSGAVIPTSGTITFNDSNITKMPEHKRANFIGRIYQNPLVGTSGSMTIEQNMTLCSKKGFRGLKISLNNSSRSVFAKELEQLDMALETRLKDRVGLLSGGQRQALTLLTTVMTKPDLLLLDEHTAALDPRNADIIMKLTKKFIDEYNITAMMVTHNMHQAIEYGNRLIMMDKGKIILDIPKEEKEKLSISSLIEIFKSLKSSLAETDEVMLD